MATAAELPPFSNLPGADLAARGIEALAAGQETVDALLVAMAAPRLLALGVAVPAIEIERPSHRLYDLLAAEHGNAAHFRYNALVARMVSFADAAENARPG